METQKLVWKYIDTLRNLDTLGDALEDTLGNSIEATSKHLDIETFTCLETHTIGSIHVYRNKYMETY